jgi:hypothetical protein
LPPRSDDDDDADGPPLACERTSEAAAIEVAALTSPRKSRRPKTLRRRH